MFFDVLTFLMSGCVRSEQDEIIDGMIRPPKPVCVGADDPLGRDGKAAWDLTDRLVPRGSADRADLVAASLQPLEY